MHGFVHRVPISTLVRFLKAVAAHPSGDVESIAEFAGDFSRSTARRALPTLQALGMIAHQPDGRWISNTNGISRGTSDAEATLAFRRSLQAFRPFEALCEGLALGEPLAEASRRASLLVGWNGDKSGSLDVLAGWGIELGVLQGSNGDLRLAPELQPPMDTELDAVSVTDLERPEHVCTSPHVWDGPHIISWMRPTVLYWLMQC